MTMKSKLSYFKEHFITSKKELIDALSERKSVIDDVAKKDKSHSYSYYSAIKDGFDNFVELLSVKALPTLPEPFAYELNITIYSIALKMIEVIDIHEYKDIKGIAYDVGDEYTLIELPFKLLSIEEYANENNTNIKTVSQWIRRGKIKSAKKIGREWYIPEIAEITKPEEKCEYVWNKDKTQFDDEYTNLSSFTELAIIENKDDKTKFKLSLYDEESGKRKETMCTVKEKEKLEVMLISNNNVEYRDKNILTIAHKAKREEAD